MAFFLCVGSGAQAGGGGAGSNTRSPNATPPSFSYAFLPSFAGEVAAQRTEGS